MYATPPGAVEIDDVAEAGGVDGLNSGAGRLRTRGRGLCVDSSREDGNAKVRIPVDVGSDSVLCGQAFR